MLVDLKISGVPGTIQLQTHGAADIAVSTELIEKGVWEPFETAVLIRLLRRSRVFVDVGANIGYYTLLASRVMAPGGSVFAFEPDAANFQLLEKNIARNRAQGVTEVAAAVADGGGTATLFRSPENLGDHRLFARSAEERSAEVPTVGLDEYFGTRAERPDLIKVDAQGAEPLILEGMDRLRSDSSSPPTLLLEFWPRGIVGLGRTVDDLVEQLVGGQYRIMALFEEQRRGLPATGEDLRRWSRTILAPNTERFINLLLTTGSLDVWEELTGAEAPSYEPGTWIDFGAGGNARRYQVPMGWSYPEAWGTWTDGPAAELRLSVDRQRAAEDLQLIVQGHGQSGDGGGTAAQVQVNDEPVADWRFPGERVEHRVLLRQELLARAAPLHVAFHIESPRVPAESSASGDVRRLGIGLQHLALMPAGFDVR